MGGSVLSLGSYLKHCDASLFKHEVLFYQPTKDAPVALEGRWRAIELGFSVPPQSRPERGRPLKWIRRFLVARPRLEAWAWGFREWWQLVASLPKVVRLARRFRHEGYALVHCNNSFTYQNPTVLGAWLARTPLVCHFRTIRRLTPLQQLLARLPICFVAINGTVADNLRRQGVRRPVFVCPNPIEIEESAAHGVNKKRLYRELLGDGKNLVGIVTRLEDGKGVEDLLAAARLLRPRWPLVRYVIVGSGSKAETLQRLAVEWGLEQVVCFEGFRRNVFDYLACLDIFVCASLAEGGPRVVVEAMLAGKPVVTTKVGMVAELIRNGENGMVVNCSDPSDLARAIESMLASPSKRKEMGERAVATASTSCDPAIQAQRLDNLFARVLSSLPATVDGVPVDRGNEQSC